MNLTHVLSFVTSAIFHVWGFGKHIALDAALAILAALESMDIEEIRTNILNFKGIKKTF